MDDQQTPDVGLTRAISIIYLFYGLGFLVAAIGGAEVAGIKLEWSTDVWVPLIFVLAAIGTLRRTKWGRWMSYPMSILFLPGVPIGTLLGGFMLWHLTRYRIEFNRWY
jgi:hypothetical protein